MLSTTTKALCAKATGAVERFREVTGGHLTSESATPKRACVLLIVDDEDEVLRLLPKYLAEDWPGEIAGATTLAEAVDILLAHDVRAALVDWKLPQGPPLTLMSMLKERGIPTKVITGDETKPAQNGVGWGDILSKSDLKAIAAWVRETAASARGGK